MSTAEGTIPPPGVTGRPVSAEEANGAPPEGDDVPPSASPAEVGSYSITPIPKKYTKSSAPLPPEQAAKREKKNMMARSRADKLRQTVAAIELKPPSQRTEEEQDLFDSFMEKRERKNSRSKERALEKKAEVDRILAIPERKVSLEGREVLVRGVFLVDLHIVNQNSTDVLPIVPFLLCISARKSKRIFSSRR
jgi:hypothetical protein